MLRQLLIKLHLHLLLHLIYLLGLQFMQCCSPQYHASLSCYVSCMLYAFVFPKLPIVKFYRSKAASEGSLTVAADLAAGGIENSQNQMVFFFNSQQISYNCI